MKIKEFFVENKKNIKFMLKGGFSTVYLYKSKYIVKHNPKDVKGAMIREFQLMREIESAYSISPTVYLFLKDNNESLLLMQYVGPALDEIECYLLSKEEKMLIIYDIIECLDAIHAIGIVHRDLKPDNFCVCSTTGCVKLIDFGMSKKIEINGKMIVKKGLREYMAGGTFDYCSDNTLKYLEPTFKDDWESFTLLVAFILGETMPLQDLRGGEEPEMIKYRSFGMQYYLKDMIYFEMYWNLICYFRSLHFHEKPLKSEIYHLLDMNVHHSKHTRSKILNRARHYQKMTLKDLESTKTKTSDVGTLKNPSIDFSSQEFNYKRQNKLSFTVSRLTRNR